MTVIVLPLTAVAVPYNMLPSGYLIARKVPLDTVYVGACASVILYGDVVVTEFTTPKTTGLNISPCVPDEYV